MTGEVTLKISSEQSKKVFTGPIDIQIHHDRRVLQSFLRPEWRGPWGLERPSAARKQLLGLFGIPGRQPGRFSWVSLLLPGHWQFCYPNISSLEVQTSILPALFLPSSSICWPGTLHSGRLSLLTMFLCSLHICHFFINVLDGICWVRQKGGLWGVLRNHPSPNKLSLLSSFSSLLFHSPLSMLHTGVLISPNSPIPSSDIGISWSPR